MDRGYCMLNLTIVKGISMIMARTISVTMLCIALYATATEAKTKVTTQPF